MLHRAVAQRIGRRLAQEWRRRRAVSISERRGTRHENPMVEISNRSRRAHGITIVVNPRVRAGGRS
jgi:ribosomal protein L32E